MRKGRLRHTVRIEQDVSSTEDLSPAGDPGDRWRPIPRGSNVPAEVIALDGGEKQVGSQQQAIADTQVTIDYRDDIKSTMRIVFGKRILNIARPPFDPTGRRRELVCHCKEQA